MCFQSDMTAELRRGIVALMTSIRHFWPAPSRDATLLMTPSAQRKPLLDLMASIQAACIVIDRLLGRRDDAAGP